MPMATNAPSATQLASFLTLTEKFASTNVLLAFTKMTTQVGVRNVKRHVRAVEKDLWIATLVTLKATRPSFKKADA